MRSGLLKLVLPMLALSLQGQAPQANALAGQSTIRIHAKIIDWRGRPAVGSAVSLTVLKRNHQVTATLYHQDFQGVATDGSIDLEGPPGIWKLDVYRTSTRRGHPSIERNVSKSQGAPEFLITTANTLDKSLVFKLGLAEWNVDTGTATWMLDMTTCTQGQTFRMDEIRAIPMR